MVGSGEGAVNSTLPDWKSLHADGTGQRSWTGGRCFSDAWNDFTAIMPTLATRWCLGCYFHGLEDGSQDRLGQVWMYFLFQRLSSFCLCVQGVFVGVVDLLLLFLASSFALPCSDMYTKYTHSFSPTAVASLFEDSTSTRGCHCEGRIYR